MKWILIFGLTMASAAMGQTTRPAKPYHAPSEIIRQLPAKMRMTDELTELQKNERVRLLQKIVSGATYSTIIAVIDVSDRDGKLEVVARFSDSAISNLKIDCQVFATVRPTDREFLKSVNGGDRIQIGGSIARIAYEVRSADEAMVWLYLIDCEAAKPRGNK